MSRKPDFAQDLNDVTQRTDQNLLRLLDHAKRDDQQNQVGSPTDKTNQSLGVKQPTGRVGDQDKESAIDRNSPSQKSSKPPAQNPRFSDSRKTFTTQLPPSTIRRLKRATSHQHLNELQPDTIQGIVDEAIEEWCNKRNYA